jgi:hypothetical protein
LKHIGVLAISILLFFGPSQTAPAQSSTPVPSPAPLPDAPSAVANAKAHKKRAVIDPCAAMRPTDSSEAMSAFAARNPCPPPSENPYMRFLNSTTPHPLTPRQKAHLAARDVLDPFNLLTITGSSAYTVASDSHTAYGPGMHGFARAVGTGFSQDVTGEFIGTFAVCSIFHEDPHYHREPDRPMVHRFFHAIGRTVIAQHDEGGNMPNFQNLITYPAAAMIANLYVPGIATNVPSTFDRVLIGLATDPINNLITEFLPDVARRIHIHIVFVQQILNQVAAPNGTASGLP